MSSVTVTKHGGEVGAGVAKVRIYIVTVALGVEEMLCITCPIRVDHRPNDINIGSAIDYIGDIFSWPWPQTASGTCARAGAR